MCRALAVAVYVLRLRRLGARAPCRKCSGNRSSAGLYCVMDIRFDVRLVIRPWYALTSRHYRVWCYCVREVLADK